MRGHDVFEITPGTRALYNFDGTLNDRLGAFNGTLSATTATDPAFVPSKRGQALELDRDDNQRVSIGEAMNGARLIEVWTSVSEQITQGSQSNNTLGLVFRDSPGGVSNEGGLWYAAVVGRFGFSRRVGTSYYTITADRYTINPGEWVHIICNIHPTTGMEMWINGVNQTVETSATTEAFSSNSDTAYIGCWGTVSGRYFPARIGGLKISTQAYEPHEIQKAIYDMKHLTDEVEVSTE